MIKVDLIACKGGFEDKIKNLADLEDEYAEVGWFAEQGTHPTAEMTFAELARYHASGSEGVTPRPMLHIALKQYSRKQPKEVGKVIINYLVGPTEANLNKVIETIGETYWNTVKMVIGNPSYLEVTNNPTPLLDSGALKEHTAYRTSKQRTLKT